jgi:hypothetical protein
VRAAALVSLALAALVLCGGTSMVTCGCSRPAAAAAPVALAVSDVAAEARGVLLDEYRRESYAAADAGATEVQAVRARWRPVWAAWDAVAVADAALVGALRANDSGSALAALGRVRVAWCDLRHVEPRVPEVPALPCSGGAR